MWALHESFCLAECVSDWLVRGRMVRDVGWMKKRTCMVRHWRTVMHGLCSSAVDCSHLITRRLVAGGCL